MPEITRSALVLWWKLDRARNLLALYEHRCKHPVPSTAVERLSKAMRALEVGVDPELVRVVLDDTVVGPALTRARTATSITHRRLAGIA